MISTTQASVGQYIALRLTGRMLGTPAITLETPATSPNMAGERPPRMSCTRKLLLASSASMASLMVVRSAIVGTLAPMEGADTITLAIVGFGMLITFIGIITLRG